MVTPQDDLDTLLQEAASVALHFLNESQEFFPFAVVIATDGEVRHIQGSLGTEQPDSSELIAFIEQSLRSLAEEGEIRACALISDVRISQAEEVEFSDAIQICIEHAEQDPLTCYLPYVLQADGVVPGELSAEVGMRVIFQGPDVA
jgi:hypothetical protein